jgi:hypothetical protein
MGYKTQRFRHHIDTSCAPLNNRELGYEEENQVRLHKGSIIQNWSMLAELLV